MIKHNENDISILSKIVMKLKRIKFNKVYVLATIEEVTEIKRISLIGYKYLTSNTRLIILRKVKIKGEYRYIDELTNKSYFMINKVIFHNTGESYISNIHGLANTLEDTQKLKQSLINYQESLAKEENSSRRKNGIKAKYYLKSLTDKKVTFEGFNCGNEICANCVICNKVEYETLLKNVLGFPVCTDCISKYSQ